MRISDWSSDVCSSDLRAGEVEHVALVVALRQQAVQPLRRHIDMAGGAGAAAAALGAHAEILRGQHLHQGIALLKRELVHAALPVGCDNLHNHSLITTPVMPPAAFRVARSIWWCTGSAASGPGARSGRPGAPSARPRGSRRE